MEIYPDSIYYLQGRVTGEDFRVSDLREMPLFPLGTVLFPGMILPLHIFEPRYRLMIKGCIENSLPFGVVLIEKGHEVGDVVVPYDVGTSAYITHVDPLDDGRMNIQAVGYQRFRVLEFKYDKPYLSGMIKQFPLEGIEDDLVGTAVKELLPHLHHYIDTFIQAAEVDINLDQIPDDPLALALFAAIALPLPMKDKQKLLAEPALTPILRMERDMLRREQMLLQHMIVQQDRGDDSPLISAN
jgi:Lon protease-like protein